MVVAQLILLLLPFVFVLSLFRVVRDVAGDLEVFFFLLLLLLLSELKLLMMVDIGGHH